MIYDFLEPFQEATLKLEKDSTTLNEVLYMMDILKEHYAQTYISFFYIPIIQGV